MQLLLNDLLGSCCSNLATVQKQIDSSPEEYTRKVGIVTFNLIKETYKSLLDVNYQKFDPLVGEASCQIRAAYGIDRLPGYFSKKEKLLKTIEEVERLTKVLLSEDVGHFKGGNVTDTLSGWIKKHQIFPLAITEDDRYFILSHLLTTTRNRENRLETDFNQINCYLQGYHEPLEESPAKNIIFRAKSQLSQLSVRYQRITTARANLLALWVMSGGNQVLDINGQGLQSSPCYYSCQFLVEQIKRLRAPIALFINHEKDGIIISTTKLILVCTKENRLSPLTTVEDEDWPLPCVVLEGSSRQGLDAEEVVKALLGERDPEYGGWDTSKLDELVLTTAALHYPYMGKKKGERIPLYKEESSISSQAALIRDKITGVSKENVRSHLLDVNSQQIKSCRMECDNNSSKVDSIVLLSEVIASKLEYEDYAILAETKKLGELKDGTQRPDALFALKHIYNLSLYEAWKGGGEE